MALPYTRVNFVDGTTPLNAANLNKLDLGIADLDTARADAILKAIVDAKGDLIVATAADIVARLAVGTDGQVLTADAASAGGVKWAAAASGAPSRVTALPGSPTDGQEVILMDSLTAPTWQWRLLYVSGKASNKWIFLGGAPAWAQIDTEQSTASTTYAALTTAGPSIAVPVAGVYLVEIGFSIETLGSASGTFLGYMSYDIGGTGAVDADATVVPTASNANPGVRGTAARTSQKTLTAVTLTSKYKVSGAITISFTKRWMRLTPVAIGG